MRKKVWLDVDTGHDDAFALFLALHSEKLELLGVSACHGNGSVRDTTNNTARCLVGFHAPSQMVVFGGAGKAMLRPFTGGAHRIHGEDGLQGVEGLPSASSSEVQARISSTSATEALRQTCFDLLQKGQKMTLIATGPFTNIAVFLLAYQKLAEQTIDQILIMGGCFREAGNSNRSRTAEWNVYADPEAAKVLLQAHTIPVKIFPLDVTHKAIFRTKVEYRELTSRQTNIRLILSSIAKFFGTTYKSIFQFDTGPPVHDILTVAYLCDPSIFPLYHEAAIDVELYDPDHRGRLKEGGPHFIKQWIADDVDSNKLWTLFFAALDNAERVS